LTGLDIFLEIWYNMGEVKHEGWLAYIRRNAGHFKWVPWPVLSIAGNSHRPDIHLRCFIFEGVENG